jgi:DNA transformation protein
MSKLCDLPNVGKVLEGNLINVGITTPEQLKKIGSKEAFMSIRKKIDPGACLHMLYGIEGAIEGIRDTKLDSATKDDLKNFYNNL